MTVVLLIGGLGYIVSNITAEVLNSNDIYKVIVIDNLEKYKIKLSICWKERRRFGNILCGCIFNI